MDFFYFINKDYLICDIECSAQSKNTIDISFFSLANNEKLLDLLSLYYMQGNYGVKYTFESRAKWFAGYINSFTNLNREKQYQKLCTNPTIRILFSNEKLLKKVKKLLV